MSQHALETRSPQWNTAMLDVPPPTSTLATVQANSREWSWAPAPLAAMMDSRSGPAEATTNSPASSDMLSVTSSAFSLREDSPVMMTAPVCTSAGVMPARPYSRSISEATAATSIRLPDACGVG